MNNLFLLRFALAALSFLFFQPGGFTQDSVNPELALLQAKLERREKQLAHIAVPNARGAMTDYAATTVLAEEAVRFEAQQKGVTASPEEVHATLVQILGKQGILDVLNPPASLERDANVLIYLESQKFPYEDLQSMGEMLTLWTKLTTQGITVSKQDVDEYLKANPSFGVVPERVQIKIGFFEESPSSATGGVRGSAWAAMSPIVPLSVRGGTAESPVQPPADWVGLSLYLPTSQLEPNLRQAVSEKRAGDAFGPVTLNDGSVLAGTIVCVLPETELTGTALFRDFLPTQVALAKVNDGEKQFDAMVERYFDKAPGRRGFWGGLKKIGKYAWKGLPYIGAAGGAIVGGVYGGWGGAVAGGKLGWGVAYKAKEWWNNRSSSSAYQMPQNYSMPAYQQYAPPSYYQGYGQYQVSPMPANYGGYYNQQYHQPYYSGGYGQPNGYGGYQQSWAPPMYYPQPVRYY